MKKVWARWQCVCVFAIRIMEEILSLFSHHNWFLKCDRNTLSLEQLITILIPFVFIFIGYQLCFNQTWLRMYLFTARRIHVLINSFQGIWNSNKQANVKSFTEIKIQFFLFISLPWRWTASFSCVFCFSFFFW